MRPSPRGGDLPVVLWLGTICALIALTLTVGGATRLTNSGLSMTEWKPIVGAIPPLSTGQWQEAFALYRQIPEYRIENPRMDLEGFKTIYYWEYAHRNLGRLLGLAFLAPFLIFLLRRRLSPPLIRRLLFGFALGGAQAGLGWYMVSSGLVERTDVSPYRLAAHLGLAFVIYTHFLRILLDLLPRNDPADEAPIVKRSIELLRFAIVIQILFGALTAGLKAGYSYNTFPLMNGEWLPSAFGTLPWWRDPFENTATVQFVHRWLGMGVFIGSIFVWHRANRLMPNPRLRTLRFLPVITTTQVLSGLAALIFVMPRGLALAHQSGALALWTLTTMASGSLGAKPRARLL